MDSLASIVENVVIGHIELGLHLLWKTARENQSETVDHGKEKLTNIIDGDSCQIQDSKGQLLQTSQPHDLVVPDSTVLCTSNQEKKPSRAKKMDKKIFVKNVNYRSSQGNLWHFFEKFGAVAHCRLLWDDRKRRSRGKAILAFKSEEAVAKVLSASQEDLFFDYRHLWVEKAEWKKRGGDQEEKIERVKPTDSHNQVQVPTFDYSPNVPVDSVTIHHLNSDILQSIFSYLSLKERIVIERVCKHWSRESVQSWQSVRKIQLRAFLHSFGGLSDKSLKHILHRVNPLCLEELDLSVGGIRLTDKAMEAIGQFCPNLRKLNLDNMNIGNRCLRAIAEKCPHLQDVHLGTTSFLGEDGIWWLFHRCKDLRKVVLAGNKRLKGQCLHVACKSIEFLDLESCSKLQDIGLKKITTRCPQISELYISDCMSVTDEGILAITQECKTLKVLHMKKMRDVTNVGFSSISTLPNLLELNLTANSELEDEALIAIGANCSQLKILDISICYAITSMGVAGLQHIQLTSLDISYLSWVTNEGVIPLFELGFLEKVTCRACSALEDEAIRCLASNCTNLILLDISGCMQFHQALLECFVRTEACRDTNLHIVAGNTGLSDLNSDKITVSYENRALREFRSSLDFDLFLDMGMSEEDEEEEQEDERREQDEGQDEENERSWDNNQYDDMAKDGAAVAVEQSAQDLAAQLGTGAGSNNDDLDHQEGAYAAFVPAGAEENDAFQHQDDFDYFLENDDPLEYERWDMS